LERGKFWRFETFDNVSIAVSSGWSHSIGITASSLLVCNTDRKTFMSRHDVMAWFTNCSVLVSIVDRQEDLRGILAGLINKAECMKLQISSPNARGPHLSQHTSLLYSPGFWSSTFQFVKIHLNGIGAEWQGSRSTSETVYGISVGCKCPMCSLDNHIVVHFLASGGKREDLGSSKAYVELLLFHMVPRVSQGSTSAEGAP
jgi:hypothetical protein